MAPLTRDEAQTRAEFLTVERYTIDLDFTQGEETYGSTTTIRFTARQDGDTFAELRPAAVHRITLDGQPLDPGLLSEGRVPLSGLAAGPHELYVEADMPYSRTGEGMHRFTDPSDGLTYLYSMCCMAEAPLVYAAFDQPDLKAVFDVRVTAPEEWTVVGNGVATRTPGRPGHWTCAATPPLSTYLMAVAAGPWHSVRTEHAGIPFGIHVRQSLAEHLDADAEEIFDISRRCFDRFHEIFDEPYPFDSYDQAFVPEFNAGAMENPGLVTFREEYVHRSAVTDTQRQLRGVVIAHEMAHMWFGDLVTLRWWDDIWLNESFAEFMGYQVLSDVTEYRPWIEFSAARKPWGYDADQRPSTHPVAPDSVPDTDSAWLNFDGISYAKGASALRQLVTWLGEKTFLAGINDHFARHRFANATLADFIDSMARASGRDVHAWADSWLRTSGPDTLLPAIEEERTERGARWRLSLRHTGGRPHRLRLGTYDTDPIEPGRAVPRDHQEIELTTGGGLTEHAFDGPRPDLLVINDGDLTYAKVRLDEHSWDTAQRVLSSVPDPLTRSVVWSAARDMVRDGELAPLAYVHAAREQLPAETETAIIEGVLAFARREIADWYLAPAARTQALELLSELAEELLRQTDAEPGAGRRLVAVRTLIGAATTPELIRDWSRAGTVPGGPELDHELSWRLLYRRAVLADTSLAEIQDAADRDPSEEGQRGAARCRAALPDAQAKALAWEAMFGEADALSNYLFTATAEGFWQPEQRALLQPYAQRYYQAAAEVAARRGHALAQAAARHAFPRGFVDEDMLRRGEEQLAGDTLTASLRRGLADQVDDLRRALRIRR